MRTSPFRGAGGVAAAAGDAIRQGRPLDQLEDQRLHPVRFLEAVDGADVRMIERREHARFAVEPRHPLAVRREHGWQYLDRDITAKLCVVRAIDFAHPARADERFYFVGTEPCAGRKGHGNSEF